MVRPDQAVQQAMVVPRNAMKNGLTTTRLALFNEDGTPFASASKNVEKVNFLDYVTGTYNSSGDHSQALKDAITAANGNQVVIPEGYVANLGSGLTIDGSVPVNLKGRIRCSSTANAILVNRDFGSPFGVTVTQSFQFGATGTTGAQNLSKVVLSGGAYSQFVAGDAYHISSNDLYSWFGDDAQTQHPVLAGFMTVLGLGMDMPSVVTATPPVEFLMVKGANSGAQAMVQAVILGAGVPRQVLFHKVSGNFIPGENLVSMTTGSVSPYAANTVVGTAGSLYLLKAGERFQDNYATSAQIRKVDQSASLKLDLIVEVSGDVDAALSTRKEAILIRGQYAPQIKAEIRGAYSKALVLKSCYYGRIEPIVVGALPNHTVTGAFGYGVSLDGCTEGVDVINPYGRYLRHCFTTNVNPTALWFASGISDTGILKLYEWGTPKYNTVHGGFAKDTTAACWDVHPGAYHTSFIGTRGVAPSGGGRSASTTPQVFSNRGYGTKWLGCQGEGGGIQDSSWGTPAGFFFTNQAQNCVFENVQFFGFTVPFDAQKDSVSGFHWGTLRIKGTTFTADGTVAPYASQVGLQLRAMRAVVEDTTVAGFNGAPISLDASSSGGILEFTNVSVDYSRAPTVVPIQINGTFEVTFDLKVRAAAGLSSIFQFKSGSSNIGLAGLKRVGAVALPSLYSNDSGASGQCTWRDASAGIRPATVVADNSTTITPLTNNGTAIFYAPLSADRTATLSDAQIGGTAIRISRLSSSTSVTGTRYVNVVGTSNGVAGVALAQLGPNQWVDLKWANSTLGWVVEAQSTSGSTGTPGTNGTNGTNGVDGKDGALAGDALTVGTETLPRMLATTRVSLASGTVFLSYFTSANTETITKIRFQQDSGAAAAGATPTLVKFGLYSVDPSTGALTLLSSTANDTTIFATLGPFTRDLLTPVAVNKGTRYAVGILVVTAATAPSVPAGVSPLLNPTEAGLAPVLAGRLTGQTDLPSSITTATASGQKLYAVVRP